jgi:TPR repeat protein
MTDSCVVSARALGQVWAYNGEAERAIHWYRRAAEAGDPKSMFHLGWIIEHQAVETYNGKAWEAAALGQTSGFRSELRPQFDLAASWYRRAAEAGFAPAMNNLGQLYARGLNGSRNPQMAAYYYRMAAQAGNPVAGFNLSLAHLAGDGVAQNGAEALKHMEWSPSKKYSEADLQSPTLERTRFNGGMLGQGLRERLRSAAEAGPPATAKMEFRPMRPVSNLPTFEEVRRQSRASRR